MSEPACTFHDGHILWRGVYLPRDQAEDRAAGFEAVPDDWFKPAALEFAAQVRAAIKQYDAYHRKDLAA